MITGLDHVLIGVRDLEAAPHADLRLGFAATSRGRHIGCGTGVLLSPRHACGVTLAFTAAG